MIPVRRMAMSGTPRAAFSGSDEKAVWYKTRVRYSPKMVALEAKKERGVSMRSSAEREGVQACIMACDPGRSAVTAVWRGRGGRHVSRWTAHPIDERRADSRMRSSMLVEDRRQRRGTAQAR